MRVSINMQLNLKDQPKNYLGLCRENYAFGKDRRLSLFKMTQAIMATILDWYSWVEVDEDLNGELDKIREWMSGLRYDEPESSESG